MCSPLHGAEPSASVSGALKHTSISAARTRSTSLSGSWGGSNAPCSCSTGSKAWNCADAAMPGSARASSVISSRRSSAPSNKAGKQGRQTRPDCRRSAEVPAVSCLRPQPRHRRDRVRELTYTAAGARCMARPYIAAQPGAHQLAIDTRRCPVQPGGGRSGRLTGNPCHAEPSKIPYRNTCRGRVSPLYER